MFNNKQWRFLEALLRNVCPPNSNVDSSPYMHTLVIYNWRGIYNYSGLAYSCATENEKERVFSKKCLLLVHVYSLFVPQGVKRNENI